MEDVRLFLFLLNEERLHGEGHHGQSGLTYNLVRDGAFAPK